MASRRNGIRLKLAWAVFFLALLVPVWFAVAALGARFGLWSWQFGLGKMTVAWGGPLTMGVGVLAVITLLLGLVRAPRVKPVILSIIALFILGLVMGRLLGFKAMAEGNPPIHDVQTDWNQPIFFSGALLSARGDGGNPVIADPTIIQGADSRWPGSGGQRVADAQAIGYPGIKPLLINAPVDVVYSAALATVRENGWAVVTSSEAEGVIEATDTSRWFGFSDDIAIRITAQGEGARVDVRSVSRVGLSDLGANARRVETLLADIKAKLAV